MSEREGDAGPADEGEAENEHAAAAERPDGGEPGTADPSPQPPALGAALRRFARSAQAATREVAEAARPHVEQAARRASEEARHAAEVARPRAEEIGRQARAAAEAARPRAEQAARDTARYAREHEEELRRAGASGARAAARVVTPRSLRPAIDAFEEGLRDAPKREEPEAPRKQPTADAEGERGDESEGGTPQGG